MGNNTVVATDATLPDLISGQTPVLVDFWAEWCAPCKMMSGPLDEIAAANTGKLTVAALNVDENQQAAMTHEIMSLPTMIIFAGGVERRRLIGARSKHQLEEDLAEFIV
jgi:thioredoxin 1